jgi:hypothetical protein
VEGSSITATFICEKSKHRPLDGFITMKNGNVKSFSAITRKNSRPLNGKEVKNVLAVNLCIVCHNNAKDKIYQKELDYRVLDDCLNRPVPVNR